MAYVALLDNVTLLDITGILINGLATVSLINVPPKLGGTIISTSVAVAGADEVILKADPDGKNNKPSVVVEAIDMLF